MSGALDGITVIDLAQARAGPACVRVLADLGAEVIQVVRPAEGGIDASFTGADRENLHRNKRSIAINLQINEGRELLLRLVKDADILIENFRPDVKHRLGIDYEKLSAVNPRLIYGSISGFGQDGPYGPRPGVDQIAQGLGGIMSVTGPPGMGPWRVGIAVCDMAAGMNLAQAVLGALYERERSGKGQWVHTSLLESALALLDFQAARWLISNEVAEQAGNDHPTGVPTGVFKTADGIVNIAATSDKQFRDFTHAIDAADMAEDERFKTARARRNHRQEVRDACEEKIRQYTTAEMVERLNNAGVPCGPILRIDQVFDDPQVKHLGVAMQVQSPYFGDLRVVRSPFTLSRTPTSNRHHAPKPGEQTQEILREHGVADDEIAVLSKKGVIQG
jgi:formyl-CoA transferase